MNYSQMIEFEEEYRKVFLLDPDELKFIMDDLRGVPMTLPELVQVLLDGGIGPEYLREKYKTNIGDKSLIMVIACQDTLEVDFTDIAQRQEQYYVDLENALKDYAATLCKEKEQPATEGTVAPEPPSNEVVRGSSSGDPEGEATLSFSSNEEKGGAVAYSYENKYGVHSGLVSSAAGWDPGLSIDRHMEQTDSRWSARVMHAGWCEAKPHYLRGRKGGQKAHDLPIPWDWGQRRPVRTGFTPKQWLQVVREVFPAHKAVGFPCDALIPIKDIGSEYNQIIKAKPGFDTPDIAKAIDEASSLDW